MIHIFVVICLLCMYMRECNKTSAGTAKPERIVIGSGRFGVEIRQDRKMNSDYSCRAYYKPHNFADGRARCRSVWLDTTS